MLHALRAESPPAAAGLDDKRSLLEFLLSSEDLEPSAQHAVDWLAARGGMKQVACAAIQGEPPRLVAVAGCGVRARLLEDFSLAIEDAGHPLVRVLGGARPMHFPLGPSQPQTPLVGVAFHALPLRSQQIKQEQSAGLLLVSSTTREVPAPARWVAEVLGEKLVGLRARRLLADAEQRFKHERTLLYRIVNAVTDPILLTDTEGKLIFANVRAEKLFSAPDDASEGLRHAVAMNNMLFSSAMSAAAMGHAESARSELLLVDPGDGSDLLFELFSSVVNDPRQGTGIVSILRNITDLGRASAEIEESHKKLRTTEAEARAERHRIELIMDSVADPILVTDAEGDIVMMNAPAEKLFARPAEQAEKTERVLRANDAHFSSFVARMLSSGGRLYRGEFSLTEPSSERAVPVEAVAGKVLSQQGELTAVVTILHDRTEAIEKARLYEQLKEASGELEAKVHAATAELAQQNELLRRQAIALEQASAAKTQFLANVSHELRTPLNAILGYTSMMLQGVQGELSQPQKRGLARVDSNGRHLLGIISDLLDLTRIESGRMPVHNSSFKVAELVGEVTAELDPIIGRSQLAVTTDIPARMPEVKSDRQKVKQILLNLLSNALKFTHEGSVTIAGRYDRAGDMVLIAVTDTGIGIASADREKVFEDFRQLDASPARSYGGTGLGLSICRRLAATLGGEITLQSELWRGSTFTLLLPRWPRQR